MPKTASIILSAVVLELVRLVPDRADDNVGNIVVSVVLEAGQAARGTNVWLD